MIEKEQGTGIIYTASVRSANELHAWLTEHGISAGRYHGRMGARDRKQVQHEFMRGDHKVMIATKAFGLGIDKPDSLIVCREVERSPHLSLLLPVPVLPYQHAIRFT